MSRGTTRSRRVLLVLLGAALVAALAFVMMRSGPLAPTRVTTVEAATGSFTPALFGIGTVEARRTYAIGPTAAGRVTRVLADVGDAVQAGQALAEMDPVDIDERIAAVEASMARAASTVTALQAQRRDAEAKRELAAINARRYVELGEKNFISPSAVEVRLQEQTSADASLGSADANIAAARQDLQRLAADKAALTQQRARTRLTAPTRGLVVSRDAEVGSTVVAGQPVLRLIDPASLWVKVRFDQGRSTGLAPGLRAQIVLRSNPGQPLDGSVARVEPLSDSVTEERIAQVAFDRIPEGVSVGELAEVTLALGDTGRTILLPNASIKRRDGGTGVWRVAAGALEFVPVRIGWTSQDGLVQVLEGVREGDQIVVYSERELDADSRIRVAATLGGRGP
jgi:HlyD family secretion protein